MFGTEFPLTTTHVMRARILTSPVSAWERDLDKM
jgi:hypothetical protein